MHRDDDEAWRAIVENFGDRAVIEPGDDPAPAAPAGAGFAAASAAHGGDDDVDADDVVPPDEEFVPPEPDPFPLPPPDRLAAWIGVLGSPVLLLLCVAFRIAVPGWAALVLGCGFVGGFLYLVARLPSGRDPFDDGARL